MKESAKWKKLTRNTQNSLDTNRYLWNVVYSRGLLFGLFKRNTGFVENIYLMHIILTRYIMQYLHSHVKWITLPINNKTVKWWINNILYMDAVIQVLRWCQHNASESDELFLLSEEELLRFSWCRLFSHRSLVPSFFSYLKLKPIS